MKIGVLLSGCGVYDGAEIHESVLTLLALNKLGVETLCIAPDIEQYHVINHLNGQEMPEKRNVLVEAARIARGNIKALSQISSKDIDGLAMPGGFGVAKNFTKWAFSGPEGEILPELKQFLAQLVKEGKPVAALCMSPTTLAKALEDSGVKARLTVGTTEAASPYDINAISQGINSVGAEAVMCALTDIVEDDVNNIITTPCYMMEASISEVFTGIEKAMNKLVELVTLSQETKTLSVS